MPLTESAPTIDHSLIDATLAQVSTHDPQRIREILAKARELKGLSFDDLPPLMAMRDPDLLEELFDTARQVKQQIYGNRMVLFAPLYISNLCANECLYCAFRASNTGLHRRMLTQDEIAAEVGALVDEGHKRLLVVAGETHRAADFEHTLEAIQTVYATAHGKANIRRVNVNLAPMSVPDFRRLKAANIGTFQLFQETYHRPTYAQMHIRGRKADYDYRLSAIDRAMTAGIDDCGIGALFGLYDWRFELLAVMAHAAHLEQTFGVGPHTISVPRIEPADGSDLASAPPHAVSDQDFRKIVALLRIAVPYTGIILSTRESAAMRHETFALGVSQISAGSRTSPGGAVLAGRHPQPARSRAGHRRFGLHSLVLHGLLSDGAHGRGLHGPGQAGRHQDALRTQWPRVLSGVPGGLRDPGRASGGRERHCQGAGESRRSAGARKGAAHGRRSPKGQARRLLLSERC
jgi:2-iminoacetate synthase